VSRVRWCGGATACRCRCHGRRANHEADASSDSWWSTTTATTQNCCTEPPLATYKQSRPAAGGSAEPIRPATGATCHGLQAAAAPSSRWSCSCCCDRSGANTDARTCVRLETLAVAHICGACVRRQAAAAAEHELSLGATGALHATTRAGRLGAAGSVAAAHSRRQRRQCPAASCQSAHQACVRLAGHLEQPAAAAGALCEPQGRH